MSELENFAGFLKNRFVKVYGKIDGLDLDEDIRNKIDKCLENYKHTVSIERKSR